MDWGESVEDYSLKYLLGQGGFAKVYRAEHKKSGTAVAIKVIDMKRMREMKLEQRVISEVEIHFRLQHPSIVQVFKVFEDKRSSSICLVMELCENGELLKHFESSTLTEKEASKFLRQIVDGFLYLQRHGIMHRDLKPANVLLTKDMNAKIADFGLATLIQESNEKHFTMCGTPNYMSPEVASGCAHGMEADVWSIGCMLFTLLVGSPPFDAANPARILSRVRLEEPIIPDVGLSADARDLIRRMLRKNPNERIKINEIRRHAFLAIDEGARNNQTVGSQEAVSVDSGRDTIAGSHASTDSRGSRRLNDSGTSSFSRQPSSSTNQTSGESYAPHQQQSSQGHHQQYALQNSGQGQIYSSQQQHSGQIHQPQQQSDRSQSYLQQQQQLNQGQIYSSLNQSQPLGSETQKDQSRDDSRGSLAPRYTQPVPAVQPQRGEAGGGTPALSQQLPRLSYAASNLSSSDQAPQRGTSGDLYYTSLDRRRPQSVAPSNPSRHPYSPRAPPTPLSLPRSVTPGPYNPHVYSAAPRLPATPLSQSNRFMDRPASNENSPMSVSSQASLLTPPIGGLSGGSSSRDDSMTAENREQLSRILTSRDTRVDDHEVGSVDSGHSFRHSTAISASGGRGVSVEAYQSDTNAVVGVQQRGVLAQSQQGEVGVRRSQQQHRSPAYYDAAPPMSAAQQQEQLMLRRRSQSVEGLNRHAAAMNGGNRANMVAVDIDIEQSPTGARQQQGGCSTRRESNVRGDDSEGAGGEKVAPLSSARLRPFRQEASNAVVHILIDGSVCLEFFKTRGGEKCVAEVLRISADGLDIMAYQPAAPPGAKFCPLRPQPAPVPLDSDRTLKRFPYSVLPARYWKKYAYAARFVDLVRSKTPKVTLYTRAGKCMLMENSPNADFDIYFYDGAKFSRTSTEFKVTECDGTSMKLEANSSVHHLSLVTQERCKTASDLHERCLTIESLLMSCETDKGTHESYFPLIIGRRPSAAPQPSTPTGPPESPVASPLSAVTSPDLGASYLSTSQASQVVGVNSRQDDASVGHGRATGSGGYNPTWDGGTASRLGGGAESGGAEALQPKGGNMGQRGGDGHSQRNHGGATKQRPISAGPNVYVQNFGYDQTARGLISHGHSARSQASQAHSGSFPSSHGQSNHGQISHSQRSHGQSNHGQIEREQKGNLTQSQLTEAAPLFCANIPGVGYALQLPNDVIRVQYIDGSELCILQATPVIHGYHRDTTGRVCEFGGDRPSPLPPVVQRRLVEFPRIAMELDRLTTVPEVARQIVKATSASNLSTR